MKTLFKFVFAMQLINKNTTSYFFKFILFIVMLSFGACVANKETVDFTKTYIKRKNGIVINITGNMPLKEKKIFKDVLRGQVDKNLNGTPKKIKLLGFIKYTKTQKAIYDTLSIRKSKVSLLNNMIENGYFNAVISADTTIFKKDIVLLLM